MASYRVVPKSIVQTFQENPISVPPIGKDLIDKNYCQTVAFRKKFIHKNLYSIYNKQIIIVIPSYLFDTDFMNRNKEEFADKVMTKFLSTNNYMILDENFDIAVQGCINVCIDSYVKTNFQNNYNVIAFDSSNVYIYNEGNKIPINIICRDKDIEEFEDTHNSKNLQKFLSITYLDFINELKTELCAKGFEKCFVASNDVIYIGLNHLKKYLEKYIGGTYQFRKHNNIQLIHVELNEEPFFISAEYLGKVLCENGQDVNEYDNEAVVLVNIKQAISYYSKSYSERLVYSNGYLLVFDGRIPSKDITKETIEYTDSEIESYRKYYIVLDNYKFENVAC